MVLRFLPSHPTNAEIARDCLMSVNAVKAHLKNTYAQLGVATRTQPSNGAACPAYPDWSSAAPFRTLTHGPG